MVSYGSLSFIINFLGDSILTEGQKEITTIATPPLSTTATTTSTTSTASGKQFDSSEVRHYTADETKAAILCIRVVFWLTK